MTKITPEVTVIVPTYNSLQYLHASLASVLGQTYRDFEVIVVNDGSTDGTAEYVSSLTDPRIRLVSQENQGAAAARNLGIASAKGDYIAFIDADDLWESTKLEKQVSILQENPDVGLVYTWVACISNQGQQKGRFFKDCAEGEVWRELVSFNFVRCGSVPLVRRACFETCGIFEGNLARYAIEDWDMWLRIAARYHFQVIKEPLTYYRQHEASSSKNWQEMSKGFHLVIEKNFDAVSPDLMYLKNISYGFSYMCLAWKPLQCRDKDYRQAANFCRQAVKYYPRLRFSREYVRLNVAIALMQFLKPEGYAKIRPLIYAIQKLKPQ